MKNARANLPAFIGIGVYTLFALAGCGTVKGMHSNSLDAQVVKGEYSQVTDLITGEEKQYQADKNEISFYLDRGMVTHYGANYEQSNRDLEEAERLIEEAFTKDISDYVTAFAEGNVKKTQYGGEDFENIYINVFNALNYYHLGNVEDALVEIRRSNEKLEYITGEYAAQAETWKTKLENFAGIPPELNFSNSALARYLSVLFYRGKGYLDDARIDAQEAANAFAAYPGVYDFPLPPFLVLGGDNTCAETSIPPGKARLNLLAFTGLSPVKLKPLDNYFWYRMGSMTYGIREIPKIPRGLPREERVQVDLLTLKPILAAFIAFCSMNIRDDFDRIARRDNTGTLALMLDDLYVNDGIDASLQNILKVYSVANAWDIRARLDPQRQLGVEDREARREAGNYYKQAAESALNLAKKLYGTEMEAYIAKAIQEIYNYVSSRADIIRYFIPPSDENKILRIQRRESSVTRIEAVIDGQGTFTLALLEDMGKAADLLYQRRVLRNEAAAVEYIIVNVLDKGYKKISGVPVANVLAATGIFGVFAIEAAGFGIVAVGSELKKTLGSPLLDLVDLPVNFFVSTKGIHDAAIARRVNRELGRLDDRMGRFLPDKAYAGGLNLDPGVYGITVNYYNGGTLLRSERHENVRVEAGRLNLIESFFLSQ